GVFAVEDFRNFRRERERDSGGIFAADDAFEDADGGFAGVVIIVSERDGGAEGNTGAVEAEQRFLRLAGGAGDGGETGGGEVIGELENGVDRTGDERKGG